MTTKVVVDAHAGWPVKVQSQEKQDDGSWRNVHGHIVPAMEQETFYVTNTTRVIVEEGERK